MKNLIRFPNPPVPDSNPGPDFKKHHFVLEARGQRIALDLYSRVTDLTVPKPLDPTGPKPRRPKSTARR